MYFMIMISHKNMNKKVEERSSEVEVIITIIKIIIIIIIIIIMTSIKRVEGRSSEVEEGRLPATAATSTRSLYILSISKRLLILRFLGYSFLDALNI